MSVGYSFTGDNKTPLGNIGLNYTQQGGFGVSAGINISPNIGINANINQSGAWGVGASINQTNYRGQNQGFGLNLGYRETADGKVGISGGLGYSSTEGFSTTTLGYNGTLSKNCVNLCKFYSVLP